MALHLAIETAAIQHRPVLWTAPVYRHCGIGWSELQYAAGDVAEFHKGEMRVSFPGGGSVEFISLDNPDNARGKTADLVIIDEAGFIAQRAWYEVLRPMISDTMGRALIMGTPKGHNWFWREFSAAHDQEDSAAFQAPTLGVRIDNGRLVRAPHPLENRSFQFAEAERMFQQMPERTFRQEFLAEFVDDAGLVFRNVRGSSVLEPGIPNATHRYVMGVDWAKAYDWTVLSVLDATTREQVAIDRFNQIDYGFQLARLRVMAERWHCDTIWPEANAMGAPLVDELIAMGLPVQGFTTTAASKARIIESLSLALEQHSLLLLDDETQIGELEAYGLDRSSGGTFRYSAPEGMHDDTVVALALAYAAMDQGPGFWVSDY